MDQLDELALAAALYAVFVASVTVHEAAHAWAARRGGDLTAYLGGQVSLDPRPHMRREPLGMVIVPLLGVATAGWPFGWASTPYDPSWARAHPRRAGWMSLAGPSANLALLLLSALAIRLGVGLGWFRAPEAISFAAVTGGEGALVGLAALAVSVLFSMNLLLLLLNLIPLPPLDGSTVLLLLLPGAWASRYQELARTPAFAWIGLVLVFVFFGELFRPAFLLAVNLLYPHAHYG